MSNIRVLDCTLRDGGYINDWNFGSATIRNIIGKLSRAGMDIIECGFLKSDGGGGERTLYSDVAQIARHVGTKSPNSMYVAMIAFGDIPAEQIATRADDTIDGIRLTFHNHEWMGARALAEELMEKGYDVFIQPVGTISYTDAELLALIEEVNKLRPYAFYLVDTLGSMYQNDLLRMFHLVDHNLNGNINVGFHSHNNLQLAFSNALSLLSLNTKRQIIIDASIFGMGRAAGNLCTELIAQYINDNIEPRYDITPALEILDHDILPIYARSKWGYSAPMFLSATQSCHPNYAAHLMNKQTINVKTVRDILETIPREKRHLYDKNLIEQLYVDFLSNTVDDSAVKVLLSRRLADREVLMIAPGSTIRMGMEKIEGYIKENSPVTIAINFVPLIPFDYLFISNARRLDAVRDALPEIDSSVIITSNLRAKIDCSDFIVVDYLSLLYQGEERDNAGMMALRLMEKIGVIKIALAGFDGFGAGTDYFAGELENYVEPDVLLGRNANIMRQIADLRRRLDLKFITPSVYEGRE